VQYLSGEQQACEEQEVGAGQEQDGQETNGLIPVTRRLPVN